MELWVLGLVHPMGGADGRREQIDAGAPDKLLGFAWIAQSGLVLSDLDLVLHAADRAQLALDRDIAKGMAVVRHGLCDAYVGFKLLFRRVNHDIRVARVGSGFAQSHIGAVIQVQANGNRRGFRQGAVRRDQHLHPQKPHGRDGGLKNEGSSLALRRLDNRLHLDDIRDVESPDGVFALRGFQQHLLGRYDCHSRLLCSQTSDLPHSRFTRPSAASIHAQTTVEYNIT